MTDLPSKEDRERVEARIRELTNNLRNSDARMSYRDLVAIEAERDALHRVLAAAEREMADDTRELVGDVAVVLETLAGEIEAHGNFKEICPDLNENILKARDGLRAWVMRRTVEQTKPAEPPAVTVKSGLPQSVIDALLHVAEIAVNRDECPKCGGELDTGWECNDCGFDAKPILDEWHRKRESTTVPPADKPSEATMVDKPNDGETWGEPVAEGESARPFQNTTTASRTETSDRSVDPVDKWVGLRAWAMKSAASPFRDVHGVGDAVLALFSENARLRTDLDARRRSIESCKAQLSQAGMEQASAEFSRGWQFAHDRRDCGHPCACYQDTNWPESERSYDEETRTCKIPMVYRCVMCEQEAEVERLRQRLNHNGEGG